MKVFMWLSVSTIILLTLLSTPLTEVLYRKVNEERIENFALVYAKLRLTSFHYGHTNKNSKISRIQILEKYTFTEETYNTEFALLKSDPTLWRDFQEAVIKNLEDLEKSILPKPAKKAKP